MNKIKLFFTMVVLVFSMVWESFAGWIYQNGNTYYYDDTDSYAFINGYAKSGEFAIWDDNNNPSKGEGIYLFDANGVLQTGWKVPSEYSDMLGASNELYYYDPVTGKRCEDTWKQIDGEMYYFDKMGKYYHDMSAGIEGKTYWFDKNGVMLHDTNSPDGYYIGSDGAVVGLETIRYNSNEYVYSVIPEYDNYAQSVVDFFNNKRSAAGKNKINVSSELCDIAYNLLIEESSQNFYSIISYSEYKKIHNILKEKTKGTKYSNKKFYISSSNNINEMEGRKGYQPWLEKMGDLYISNGVGRFSATSNYENAEIGVAFRMEDNGMLSGILIVASDSDNFFRNFSAEIE